MQILKIQMSWAVFSQSWLWFAEIGVNRWFPQGSPARNYSLVVTLKLFLTEWWPEIAWGHPHTNPWWHKVFLAKQDTENFKIQKKDNFRLDSILKFAFHLIYHHLLTINENLFLVIYVTIFFSFLFRLKWPEIDIKHHQWSKNDYHMPNIHSQRSKIDP